MPFTCGLPPPPPLDPPDAARVARGQALARQHHCPVCHNPDFSGREQMPRLAYQREEADSDLVDLAHFLAHFPRPIR